LVIIYNQVALCITSCFKNDDKILNDDVLKAGWCYKVIVACCLVQ